MPTKSENQSKNQGLLFLAGLAVLYVVASRRQADYSLPQLPDDFTGWSSDSGTAAVESNPVRNLVSNFLPRGVRNNNPGNIRKSNDAWQGLAADQTDPAFFRFNTMADGVRAMAVILRNYANRMNLRSVSSIINRWAPPVENDTAGYANVVADALGVNPWDTINVNDFDTLFKLIRAMIRMENGAVAALLVSDAAVSEGVQRALSN